MSITRVPASGLRQDQEASGVIHITREEDGGIETASGSQAAIQAPAAPALEAYLNDDHWEGVTCISCSGLYW